MGLLFRNGNVNCHFIWLEGSWFHQWKALSQWNTSLGMEMTIVIISRVMITPVIRGFVSVKHLFVNGQYATDEHWQKRMIFMYRLFRFTCSSLEAILCKLRPLQPQSLTLETSFKNNPRIRIRFWPIWWTMYQELQFRHKLFGSLIPWYQVSWYYLRIGETLYPHSLLERMHA